MCIIFYNLGEFCAMLMQKKVRQESSCTWINTSLTVFQSNKSKDETVLLKAAQYYRSLLKINS